MRLKCPTGVSSINIAGVEYTADGDMIEINEQGHVDAALKNGFVAHGDGIPVLDQQHAIGE